MKNGFIDRRTMLGVLAAAATAFALRHNLV